jgi:hypothetical protein
LPDALGCETICTSYLSKRLRRTCDAETSFDHVSELRTEIIVELHKETIKKTVTHLFK